MQNKTGIAMAELSKDEEKKLNEKLNQTSENSTSIRELQNKKQNKITWHGSEADLIKFFDQLFNQRLLAIKSYDEIFSILSHYFVNPEGKPIRAEKSVAAKMNLTGPKLPKGYERYMSLLDKLKEE